jgi:hypothetical protein
MKACLFALAYRGPVCVGEDDGPPREPAVELSELGGLADRNSRRFGATYRVLKRCVSCGHPDNDRAYDDHTDAYDHGPEAHFVLIEAPPADEHADPAQRPSHGDGDENGGRPSMLVLTMSLPSERDPCQGRGTPEQEQELAHVVGRSPPPGIVVTNR